MTDTLPRDDRLLRALEAALGAIAKVVEARGVRALTPGEWHGIGLEFDKAATAVRALEAAARLAADKEVSA